MKYGSNFLYLFPTGDELYALNGDKVCRLFGEVILRSTSGMELPEFLNMWGLSVPEGREVAPRKDIFFSCVLKRNL